MRTSVRTWGTLSVVARSKLQPLAALLVGIVVDPTVLAAQTSVVAERATVSGDAWHLSRPIPHSAPFSACTPRSTI